MRMQKKLKCLLGIVLSILTTALQAQPVFDYYNKKGGLYFFSTYYQPDRSTPLEGRIIEGDPSEPNAIRNFKKGILQEEIRYGQNRVVLGHYEVTKGRDSIISRYQTRDELDRISESWIFYYNHEKRRIMDITLYHSNGKKRMHYAYAGLKKDDLEYAYQTPLPDHIIDSEGYGFDQAPYGSEEEWDANGQLIKKCHYIFKPYRSLDKIQELHGAFVLYHNNGQIKEIGQYDEGRKHGIWKSYHYNGKMAEQGEYEYGFPIHNWEGFYDDGSKQYIRHFPNHADVINIHNEVQWDAKGNKTQEIILDSLGNGTKTVWNDQHTIIEFSTITMWNKNLFGKKYTYFHSGKLQRYQDFHPHADTTLLEYWGNGQKMRLHLRSKNISTQQEFTETGICTLLREWDESNKNGITEIRNEKGEVISKEITNGPHSQFLITENGVTKKYAKLNGWLEGDYEITENGITSKYQYHKAIRITEPERMKGHSHIALKEYVTRTHTPQMIEHLFPHLDSLHHQQQSDFDLVNIQIQALEKEMELHLGETFSKEEIQNFLQPQPGYHCGWDCGNNFTLFSIKNFEKPVVYIVFYNNGNYEFFNEITNWEKWKAAENFYKNMMWND
jgi:antitoxin component YwqK of YwqJK toxin-antitoxin module